MRRKWNQEKANATFGNILALCLQLFFIYLWGSYCYNNTDVWKEGKLADVSIIYQYECYTGDDLPEDLASNYEIVKSVIG